MSELHEKIESAIKLRHISAARSYINAASELMVITTDVKTTVKILRELADHLEEFE